MSNAEKPSPLSDQEMAALAQRDAAAKASLACEGMSFSAAEEAVFAEMAHLRLSYPERRQYVMRYLQERRGQHGDPMP